MITHYDLFAGIGGFSLALEEVFQDDSVRHVFCEWEKFPTSVLRQHWPDGEFWGDIAELVTHTDSKRSGTQENGNNSIWSQGYKGRQEQPQYRADGHDNDATDPQHTRLEGRSDQGQRHAGQPSGKRSDQAPDWTIVTGGFPCQPFSHAGRRKGTADDRYQWPNMFAVIRNTKPEWVIAENVRGLVTWNEGMVLETVCADLESEGYEVQPFIIPAVAVGAPHRRDRVWIIGRNPAYAQHARKSRTEKAGEYHQAESKGSARPELSEHEPAREGGLRQEELSGRADTKPSPNPHSSQVQSEDGEVPERHDHAEPGDTGGQYPDWSRNWQEVAFATCDDTVDDGLSRLVDGVPMSRSKWRQNSLKAYGNGIVPEVAMNIMQAIKESMV